MTTEQELVKSLAILGSLLTEKIVPFLEKHKDVESLDKAMNEPISVDKSDQPSRGMHALVLAHLAGNPNFDQLVEKYRLEMSGFLPSIRAPYEKIVDHLGQLRKV